MPSLCAIIPIPILSQFVARRSVHCCDQLKHIRAVCDLPLGATDLMVDRVEMDNLIGEDANNWERLFADDDANVHLYGKGEPSPGRKMGHVTRLYR